jgi:Outer membrane protein beta-barrel domain
MALLVCAAASAQLKFGIKAGANFSNVRGSDAEGNKGKTGFYAGALAEYPITEKLAVKPELLYSLQGAKAVDENEGVVTEAKVDLSYITLPVMVSYEFVPGFYAETGPQISYLTSAKAKSNGLKEDVKGYFKKVDFSWGFGLGYISPINVGINAKYNLGLSKMSAEDPEKVYNGVFQVGLVYIFGGRTFN